jgi:toxin ParE1/3/4
MRYAYTRTALRNLDEIRGRIAGDSPAAARQQVERIKDAVLQLTRTPYMGPPGALPGTRRLVRAPYVIHYRVDGETVTILTIRHGRQRPLD